MCDGDDTVMEMTHHVTKMTNFTNWGLIFRLEIDWEQEATKNIKNIYNCKLLNMFIQFRKHYFPCTVTEITFLNLLSIDFFNWL